MLEIVFFNRFQVIQGTRIKALLLQLFFSKLKLTTEEKMLMISSNSNLMCVTSGKQIMQIFIKHSRIYSNYYYYYYFLLSFMQVNDLKKEEEKKDKEKEKTYVC